MHKEKRVRICKWYKHGTRDIPVYKLGAGKDRARPTPLTNAERCALSYRKDPDARIAKQKYRRMSKRMKENQFGYKTNPYGVFYRIADQHSDRVCD